MVLGQWVWGRVGALKAIDTLLLSAADAMNRPVRAKLNSRDTSPRPCLAPWRVDHRTHALTALLMNQKTVKATSQPTSQQKVMQGVCLPPQLRARAAGLAVNTSQMMLKIRPAGGAAAAAAVTEAGRQQRLKFSSGILQQELPATLDWQV
jgi:hypothetical protein